MKIFHFSNKIAGILLLLSHCIYSQEQNKPAVESFEKETVLKFYEAKNSRLSVSSEHFQFGKKSLHWSWDGEASFGTSNFKRLTKEESPLAYGDFFKSSPTLQMAMYNEFPQNETITVAFKKGDKKEVWFDIPLNFKGWRTIWVPFYEMKGTPPKQGAAIDYEYFEVITKSKKGSLFFDDIIFSQYQDDRHQYPDQIVPFIKKGQGHADDHWMPLISFYNNVKNLEVKPISVAIRVDLKKFEKRIDDDLRIAKKYKLYISSIKETYAKLNLENRGKTVTGPPLTFSRKQSYYNKKLQGANTHNDIKDFGKVLKKIAVYYDRASGNDKEQMKAMFISATKYFLDQGWQAGSSGGTRHHIGYGVRDIATAFYIMRGLLYEERLLNEVADSLHWLFNLGMILEDEKDFHVNIDYLNTQSYYHLLLIFLSETQEKQAALLRAYSNYMSVILAQQNEEWGFKVDGTSWHHSGHYPAYGIGAFNNVPKVINILARTRFRIKTEGHKNFKNAFLTTRLYSQMYDWGFGNAGRHPFSGDISRLKQQYLLMANAGNPNGKEVIDKDVAAAYLRLWGNNDMVNTTLFTKLNGINKEVLRGYYTLPYAATAIHRNDQWAAIIKGYSKYVWASEIYVTDNRYGRYPANGTIQLLNSKGELESGFKQEGWDWNRFPGATVIYLPLEELEADSPLIMFKSQETFAGATELDGNGVFGMILNEEKGSNADGPSSKIGFPGKLKAKKSVFSFKDKMVCIGTGISSVDGKNPTQTNLFQTFLINKKDPIYTSSNTIIKFPYSNTIPGSNEGKNWLVDPYGNGYHILSDHAISLKKETQKSYHNKYSVNTGKISLAAKGVKDTQGNFASAWINHGLAPKNESYQYVIYPFLSTEDQNNFGNKIRKDKTIEVKRADNIAHIVCDKNTSTTGYSIFEANEDLEVDFIKEVSAPALIIINHNTINSLTISAVQPDLNFPKNERNKLEKYSAPVELKITLKGNWSTSVSDFIKAVDRSENTTIITLSCINGFPRKFQMHKK